MRTPDPSRLHARTGGAGLDGSDPAAPPTSRASLHSTRPGSDGRPTYDLSEWPIVVVILPSVSLSVEAYREHLRRLESALYSRGEPCALLLDVRHHPPLNAVQRKLTAAFARENEVKHPGLLEAVALVSSSPLARGAFAAVAWLFRMSYPRQAFDRTAAARVWLTQQLRH